MPPKRAPKASGSPAPRRAPALALDEALERLAVPIKELRPYPGNPRLGDVEAIKPAPTDLLLDGRG